MGAVIGQRLSYNSANSRTAGGDDSAPTVTIDIHAKCPLIEIVLPTLTGAARFAEGDCQAPSARA
jgi:hypothetical protein